MAHRKTINKSKGFTLIEILVVVAIIAILASVVLVGLGSESNTGRDAKRITDLALIQNDLELYLNHCGFYPGGSGCAKEATGGFADMALALVNPAFGIDQGSVPADPLNKGSYVYYYLTNGTPATSYVLAAHLEDPNSIPKGYTPISLAGYTSGDTDLPSCNIPYYCVTFGGSPQTGGAPPNGGPGPGSGPTSTPTSTPSPSGPSTLVTPLMIGLDDELLSNGWPQSPANVGILRLWDDGMRWSNIDPNCTNISFTSLTNWLNAAESFGVPHVTFVFGGLPACAYSAPGVVSSSAIGQFIAPIAQFSAERKSEGLKGIDYYELLNEPNISAAGGGAAMTDPMALAEYMQTAYEVVKQNDPSAKTIGPSIAYNSGFTKNHFGTDDYLAAAKSLNDPNFPFYDIQSYHYYLGNYSTSTAPEGVLAGVTGMRAIMQEYGIENLPLVNTEFSWDNPTPTTTADFEYQEAFLARAYLLLESNDVGMWWYGWGYTGTWGALFDDAADVAYPSAVAYENVTGWLMGSSIGTSTTQGTVYSIPITLQNGTDGLILWNSAGSSTYALPPEFQNQSYTSAMGATGTTGSTAPIGTLPILVTE